MSEVRERLLDAAEECLVRQGIRSTTMLEVARTAGVSRAWLYRHFPDKPALLGAALVRLGDAFWDETHQRLAAVSGLDRRIALAVELGRTLEPGMLLLRLQEGEPDEFATAIGAGIRDIIPSLAGFWTRYVEEAIAAGEIRDDLDVPATTEWILRIVISLTTMPGATLDVTDMDAVLAHVRRYVMGGLV